MGDEILVKRAQKGDDNAFYQLMQEHKEQLYRMALSYLKNEEDAVEALQETSYRAYRSLKSLRNSAYFSTWLIRILLNYCHDEVKKRDQFVLTDQIPDIIGITKDSYEFELLDALNKITEQYREIIYLRFFHDFKIREIALLLKRPEGTIKTWLYKGLEELKVELREERGGDND